MRVKRNEKKSAPFPDPLKPELGPRPKKPKEELLRRRGTGGGGTGGSAHTEETPRKRARRSGHTEEIPPMR